MKEKIFEKAKPYIKGNKKLRDPQVEGYTEATKHFVKKDAVREVGMILPVGCGKSGLIAIIPFGVKASRALVVAPNRAIRDELKNNFYPSHEKYFYKKCDVLTEEPFPEMTPIEGARINRSLLDESDVVVTNIGQLQGKENKWLNSLPDDYFDIILFDEAHHNPADSWVRVLDKFPKAKIVNFSATPRRADGQIMSGKIIYHYPIFKAIDKGYIKKMRAWVLNPDMLEYVDTRTGKQYRLTLNEIREKATNDSAFRRSIGQSEKTLNSIVDASIQALKQVRKNTSDDNHKIIAAAQNFSHCHDIVRAYQERGLRVDFVHSKKEGASKENDRVKKKLDNHELDVIVQVNMLGEGFDHPYLSVAAVFKIFANLSPFVQFVGRVMRVIQGSKDNTGIVVFHAGSNIAQVWTDFQDFSGADQDYFKKLLPDPEEVIFTGDNEIVEREPTTRTVTAHTFEIQHQGKVTLKEDDLLRHTERKALERLREMGVIEQTHVTKFDKWNANLKWIDSKAKTAAGKILSENGWSAVGYNLDKRKIHDNYVFVVSEIHRAINNHIGKPSKSRKDYTIEEAERARKDFDHIVEDVANKLQE